MSVVEDEGPWSGGRFSRVKDEGKDRFSRVKDEGYLFLLGRK